MKQVRCMIFAFLAGLLIQSGAEAQDIAGCAIRMTAPETDIEQPLNIDLVKAQLVYYHCTKYDEDVKVALSEAKDWVKVRAPQVSNPAIVLDIDETSLSNWDRILKDDFGYIPNGACDFNRPGEACGDTEWQRSAKAPAIQPTLELFNFARCRSPPDASLCKKVAVFFVTGRYETPEGLDRTQSDQRRIWGLDWALPARPSDARQSGIGTQDRGAY